MTVDEITTIADEILTRYLTASGYERVEVRPATTSPTSRRCSSSRTSSRARA